MLAGDEEHMARCDRIDVEKRHVVGVTPDNVRRRRALDDTAKNTGQITHSFAGVWDSNRLFLCGLNLPPNGRNSRSTDWIRRATPQIKTKRTGDHLPPAS